VYCDLGLNLKRKSKPWLYRPRQPMVAPKALNTIWTADFMADALYGGRAFRTFNVLDEGNREALAIEIGFSIPTKRVIRTLEALIALYGKPQALRLDNGPELTSIEFTAWCEDRNIQLMYIQPGKPDQNVFIERFNRSYREGVLDAYVFENLEQVREASDTWLVDYNQERPHDSIGGVPPNEFMPRPQLPRESSYRLLT
jgi:putative transposase